MSIYPDKRKVAHSKRKKNYWRVKYFDDKQHKLIDQYFGDNKAAALAFGSFVCDLKMERWAKKKQWFVKELKKITGDDGDDLEDFLGLEKQEL